MAHSTFGSPVRKQCLALACAGALLAGCTAEGMGPKQTGGSLLGAAGGGLIGSQIGGGSGRLAATAVGTLLGALLGSEAGKSLDRADQAYERQAEQQAYSAPVGQTIQWNNPDTGNQGSITPMRQGTNQSGQFCREYQSTIKVGGKTERGYGTACRQPDGSWKVVG